ADEPVEVVRQPCKLLGVAASDCRDHREPAAYDPRCTEAASLVGEVDLHAATDLSRKPLEGGLEIRWAEGETGKIERAEFGGKRFRFDPRRADQFEGPRRAPPDGEVRPLEETGAGVEERGLRRRDVR